MSNIFVHSVYFWLKPDLTEAQHTEFSEKVHSLLKTPGVEYGHVGVPAHTDRPVIDRTYSYYLLQVFSSDEAHTAYQTTDENHQNFIRSCKDYWTKVVIYDSVAPSN